MLSSLARLVAWAHNLLEYADLRGFTSELTKDDSSQYMIIYIYICLPTRKTRDTEILKFTCINRMIYNYNNVLVRVLSSNNSQVEIEAIYNRM